MLRLLTCGHGHFWESADATRCPQCGAEAESLPVLDLQPDPPAAPPPVPSSAQELLFDPEGRPVIAGYEILEDLGKGPTGMRLYKARHKVINRVVLLEVVLAKEDTTQYAWSSLRSQAAALARLVHPGVPQLFEVGERDRQFFFNAVELVEGPTLTQKVAGKPLPLPQAVRLVESLARTLSHAHDQSVLHRNLRPDCVRLQPTHMPREKADRLDPPGPAVMLHSGAFLPRIEGFGLVRRPVENETIDVELYGEQPGFLSPEQAWGRTQDLGPATDVYGLGAILFYLVTGHAPYQGERRADVLEAIQAGDPPPDRGLNRAGDDLRAIIRKCLARAPLRRYPSASALADDLRRLQLRLPLDCQPHTGGYVAGKWLRRNLGVAALLFLAGLAVVGTLGGFIVGYGSSGASSRQMEAMRNQLNAANYQFVQANARAQALERQVRFASHRQLFAQAQAEIARANRGAAQALLNTVPHSDRGFEWALLSEMTQARGRLQLPELAGGISAAALAPDGRNLLLATPTRAAGPGERREDRVLAWHYQAGLRKELDAGFGTVRALAISPDGGMALAVGSNRTDGGVVRAWSIGSTDLGRPLFSRQIGVRPLTATAYEPGGGEVVVANDRGECFPLHARNGQQFGPISFAFARGFVADSSQTLLAWSGRSTQLAVARSDRGDVQYWSVTATIHRPGYALPAGSPVTALASQPAGLPLGGVSGSLLAIGRQDRTVTLHGPGNPAAIPRLGPLAGVPVRLAFSPDGERLAVACDDRRVLLFGSVGSAWAELLTLPADGTLGLAFSGSGQSLLTAGPGGVTLWGRPGN